MSNDYLYVGRMEKLPRNKYGCKKGYYPPRVHAQERGETNADSFRGKSRRTLTGHVMANYAMPIGAPAFVDRKTGKAVASVHHKWTSGVTHKKVARATVFDKSSRVQERQHSVHGAPSRGRSWVEPEPIKD